MASIRIHDGTADGTELSYEVAASPDVRRFFSGDPFRVTYDRPVEDVPPAIRTIPVLAQVCPVAWACGADVSVPAVDARFARALEDVKASLLSMHDFLEGGRLRAGRLVDVDDPSDTHARDTTDDTTGEGASDDTTGEGASEGRSGLLFTGGVDSTCSYVRHREESPTLLSIRGWTITPDAADDADWNALRSRVGAFADERDLEASFVEANMLEFLDHPMLLAHYKRHVDGAWYSSVGHGLGLLGLCAPLAYADGMETLHVAATHWEGIDLEWGSRPDVDDHVRWTGTRCHHDAYDLTRQERVDVIADYVRSEAPDLQLQTCNARMDGNCGRCEKCYRTAIGLRLSGLDPNEHGYPFDDGDYRTVRRAFEDGDWILGQDEKYMWADIRDRVRETDARSPAERAFFEWLADADLDALVADAGSPLSHRLLRAGARNAPSPIYNTLYPVWTTAKRGYQRFGGAGGT